MGGHTDDRAPQRRHPVCCGERDRLYCLTYLYSSIEYAVARLAGERAAPTKLGLLQLYASIHMQYVVLMESCRIESAR